MKEIPLKQFRYEQAIKEGVGETAIANKIKRGLYPRLKLRRVNKRVVFVCISGDGIVMKNSHAGKQKHRELKSVTMEELTTNREKLTAIIQQRKMRSRRSLYGIKDTDGRTICKFLKTQGLSYQAIGDIMGVSRQRAGQLLQQNRHSYTAGLCGHCGRFKKSLHRHHVNYATDEIELLCTSCHQKAHTTGKNLLDTASIKSLKTLNP